MARKAKTASEIIAQGRRLAEESFRREMARNGGKRDAESIRKASKRSARIKEISDRYLSNIGSTIYANPNAMTKPFLKESDFSKQGLPLYREYLKDEQKKVKEFQKSKAKYDSDIQKRRKELEEREQIEREHLFRVSLKDKNGNTVDTYTESSIGETPEDAKREIDGIKGGHPYSYLGSNPLPKGYYSDDKRRYSDIKPPKSPDFKDVADAMKIPRDVYMGRAEGVSTRMNRLSMVNG